MKKILPKTRRTQKTHENHPPQTSPPLPCKVWLAGIYCGTGYSQIGYMVTEADNPAKMIALVFDDDNFPNQKRELMAHAFRIARNQAEINRMCGPWIDLRTIGRPGSTQEVPGWMYAVALQDINAEDDNEQDQYPEIDLDPFCPVRLARMQERARQWR